jgi:hypothetical protein
MAARMNYAVFFNHHRCGIMLWSSDNRYTQIKQYAECGEIVKQVILDVY